MISIIIPAHNEEKRIGPTLDSYGGFFTKVSRRDKEKYEIIVVLNACNDNTLGIVKKYEKKFKNISHLDFEQGGKGFAIIEGFKESIRKKSDLIGFVDADMSTNPDAFYDLINNLKNNQDMEEIGGVIASRWEKGAKTKRTLGKYVRSRMFNLLVRTLFLLPYKDTQCGAKIFKKHVLESIINELYITKWAFDVNLLYLCKRKHFKIKEVATIWNDKEESHITTLKVPIQMAAGVIRLRILYSPFKDFIRIYDKMPEFVKIHHNIK